MVITYTGVWVWKEEFRGNDTTTFICISQFTFATNVRFRRRTQPILASSCNCIEGGDRRRLSPVSESRIQDMV